MPSVSLPSFLGVAFVHTFPQVPGTCSFNSGSLPLALLLAISEPDPLDPFFLLFIWEHCITVTPWLPSTIQRILIAFSILAYLFLM